MPAFFGLTWGAGPAIAAKTADLFPAAILAVITIGSGIGSAVGSWAAGWIFDLLTVPQSVLPDEVIE